MTIATSLLSAVEFSRLPDPGHPQELVHGVVVDIPPPRFRHGKICGRITTVLSIYADTHHAGHVLGNDSGIVTQQNPDTVRGPDVFFVSYDKVPPDAEPDYLGIPPDAVFEIRSPSDRSREVLAKVNEYLQFGVPVVYVLDPDTSRVHCYYQDRPDEILNASDELVGIGPLAGFRVSVAKFFE
jgi:Uma2 family endonuclease